MELTDERERERVTGACWCEREREIIRTQQRHRSTHIAVPQKVKHDDEGVTFTILYNTVFIVLALTVRTFEDRQKRINRDILCL